MWKSAIGWWMTISAHGPNATPPAETAMRSTSCAASRSNDGVNAASPRASMSAAVTRFVTLSEKSPMASGAGPP